jgi:PIN domain nuclease of toxin-antitoxin system
LLSLGIREMGLSSEIAIRAVELEDMHGDPFDRIIVATAMVADAVLLTADRLVLEWPGRMHRQDAQR